MFTSAVLRDSGFPSVFWVILSLEICRCLEVFDKGGRERENLQT